MALNIFEPRYRLMIRRCMEGNRRFAMGTVDRQHRLGQVSSGALWAYLLFGMLQSVQGRARQARVQPAH